MNHHEETAIAEMLASKFPISDPFDETLIKQAAESWARRGFTSAETAAWIAALQAAPWWSNDLGRFNRVYHLSDDAAKMRDAGVTPDTVAEEVTICDIRINAGVEPDKNGEWWSVDNLVIEEDDEVAWCFSSEDPEPYERALRKAGYQLLGDAPGQYSLWVRRIAR